MFTPHAHGTSPVVVAMPSMPGLGPLYLTLIAGFALSALFLAAMSAYTARHLLVPRRRAADPEAEAAPLLQPAPASPRTEDPAPDSPLLALDEKAAPPLPQIVVSTSTSLHTLQSLEDLRVGVYDPAHVCRSGLHYTPIAPRR